VVDYPEAEWSLAAVWQNAAAEPTTLVGALTELRRRVALWQDRPLALWPQTIEVGR
jgi:hypothetical protein